ncbi:membrane protein [Streptomyces incarnatus]|uniref:Membrane protein n=1 Tax=Streptomyces incarnatus TaxID=665007 RepID=A0ABN4GH33_9ACTN|nr:membrane protein [Streptomyces incarnatus]
MKALLHRHRELCERAVDPLEIAAGLEAHGVTDRTAARFRHRDVFSLAEELYARVPRTGEPVPEAEPLPLPVPRVRAVWILLTLLPGALGAATVAGLRLTQAHPRLLTAVLGIIAVALATRAALRHGPLAGTPRTRAWRTANGTRAWTLWLLGYALLGDGLLRAVVTGGPDALPTGAPDGPWPTALAPTLALTLACAPAAWCAHLLSAGARRRLAGSRGLEDFTAAAKPLLFGAFTLFLGALTALLLTCGAVLHEPVAYPQTLALGALLLLARLLTVHGHRHAPAVALGAAAATEALALALPSAGRLPGCAVLTAPVRALLDTWGEAAVPVLACGTAALALLFHASRTLTRASAHAPTGAPD